LSGDSGKTLVALGLAAAWADLGYRVAPFKKGPDYIDAAWLSLAAKQPCRNLDTFLMDEDVILENWRYGCLNRDIAVLEGNRGIYDGFDAHGSHSTATLAKLIKTPIILVVDVTKMTRTTAALVLGVKNLDPDVNLAGVVLNRVGGKRHEKVAKEAVEKYAGIPVVGSIPRQKGGDQVLPGRHLGLVTTDEHPEATGAIQFAGELVKKFLNLDLIYKLASDVESVQCNQKDVVQQPAKREGSLKIGVVKDAAFPFYYPENLELLESLGAEIVNISALSDKMVPEGIHALYVGGGFPETHAEKISQNRGFLKSLHDYAEKGLPVYAECGGLMLLTESITFSETRYPMAGILPVNIGWSKKPAGHGYTLGVIDQENPFYPLGTEIKGHEFHHSHVEEDGQLATTVSLSKGYGVGGNRDGFTYKNVFALYTHIHAAGLPEWGTGMIKAAREFKNS